MLGVARFAVFHQLGVLVHDDERVLDRDRRHLNAQHLGGALCVVARCRHDMLGGDHDLLVRGHQVATLLDHFRAGDLPMAAIPVERIRLPFSFNRDAALTRALGHRLGHVGGVNIAVLGMIDRTFQVVGVDQRPTFLDLISAQPFVAHVTGLGGRGIEHVFVHAFLRLRHAQVADHGKARIEAGFFLKRLVEIDRVFVDMSCRIGHVEKRQKTRRMPGTSTGQLVPLQQHHIIPTRLGEVIGNRRPDGTAADNKGFDIGFHVMRLRCMT